MVRFGLVSVPAYIVTFGYIVLSILIVLISYYFIAQIDWTMPFDIFNPRGEAIMFDVDF